MVLNPFNPEQSDRFQLDVFYRPQDVMAILEPLLDSTDEAVQMFAAINMLILDRVIEEDSTLRVQWMRDNDQVFLQIVE